MGGRPVWSRTAPGPFEPYAVGYAQWLAEQGFSREQDRAVGLISSVISATGSRSRVWARMS